jgi:hypothetical protein
MTALFKKAVSQARPTNQKRLPLVADSFWRAF